jgi:hypothetical protein
MIYLRVCLYLLIAVLLLTCYQHYEKPKNPYPGPKPWRVPKENVDPSCYREGGGDPWNGEQSPPSTRWVEVECEVEDDWDVAALALGDLDGDGFADLVLTTTWLYYWPDAYWYAGYSYYGIYDAPRASTRVLVGDGKGKFNRSDALPNPSRKKGCDIWQGDQLKLGDLDGDGDLDIALSAWYPGVSDCYLYTYSCRWGGVRYYYWYQYWYVLYGRVGDVRCLRNDGKGNFKAWDRKYSGGFDAPLSALGDVDGDGDLDKMMYGADGFRLWLKEETK